ncbi:hypothetical protein D3C85_1558150 [compost metagenome]
MRADRIPNETSKNGIRPITRIVVRSPPAKAKPIAYSVLDCVQPFSLSRTSVNTDREPNRQTIIPAFKIVER